MNIQNEIQYLSEEYKSKNALIIYVLNAFWANTI
jgi:hypothetical protein